MPASQDRHFQIAGSYNVRELGGYRTNEGAVTRWGRFLRADLLGDIPAESVAALTDYGIYTAIDLRTSTELFEKPSVFARSPAIKYFNHNLLGDDELPDVVRDYKTASGMADGYAWILEERQLQIRRSFGTHSSGQRIRGSRQSGRTGRPAGAHGVRTAKGSARFQGLEHANVCTDVHRTVQMYLRRTQPLKLCHFGCRKAPRRPDVADQGVCLRRANSTLG